MTAALMTSISSLWLMIMMACICAGQHEAVKYPAQDAGELWAGYLHDMEHLQMKKQHAADAHDRLHLCRAT